jgi:hypothetical protein
LPRDYRTTCDDMTSLGKQDKQLDLSVVQSPWATGQPTKEFALWSFYTPLVQEMSWHNYGKWHVYHVRPCSLFDQQDAVQFAEC